MYAEYPFNNNNNSSALKEQISIRMKLIFLIQIYNLRMSLLQKEEEKLKPVRAKPKKRSETGSGRSHTSTTAYREEEGSDEDGAISLNAIKNKYKGGQASSKGISLAILLIYH